MLGDSGVGTLRLASQRVTGPLFEDPAAVVRWMGAMQAQDYGQALWAIAVRTKTATLASVEASIATGAILRTWPHRGTIHFVPAEDARWMVRLSEARMLAGARGRQAQLGLTQAILDRSGGILGGVLRGGKRLTRPRMMQTLEDQGIRTGGGVGYHILWYLSQIGLLCIGPMDGKQQSFALLDEWAPAARKLTREDALTELARRYFTSRGPATLQDFAWWAGLTIRDARAGLESVASSLMRQVLNDQDHWSAEEPSPAPSSDGPHLLPGFDEFLLGYKQRDAVLPPEHAQSIVPGGNGIFKPIIVENGQVVGTWKRAIAKPATEVALYPFAKLQSDIVDLRRCVERYCEFAGSRELRLVMDRPASD